MNRPILKNLHLGSQTELSNSADFFITPNRNAALCVLGDGEAGRPSGTVAAEVVRGLSQAFFEHTKHPIHRTDKWLKLLSLSIHEELIKASGTLSSPLKADLVLAYIEDDRVTVAHFGSSRFYFLRGTEVVWQTTDLPPETSPGEDGFIEPALKSIPLEGDECFLLCSPLIGTHLPEDRPGQVSSYLISHGQKGIRKVQDTIVELENAEGRKAASSALIWVGLD